MKLLRVLEGTRAGCTRDIAKHFFLIKLLVDGICWIDGRWMLPASKLLSLG